MTHAVFKTAGDALAAGRLNLDLERDPFHMQTETRILGRDEPRRSPPELPAALPDTVAQAEDPDPDELDLDLLEPDEQALLRTRRGIFGQIDEGISTAKGVAGLLGVKDRRAQQWYRTWVDSGRKDAVLRGKQTGRPPGSTLKPSIKSLIGRLHRQYPQMLPRDIASHPRMDKACTKIDEAMPTPERVAFYMRSALGWRGAQARTASRARLSKAEAAGYSVLYPPGMVAQVDEETMNLAALEHLQGWLLELMPA